MSCLWGCRATAQVLQTTLEDRRKGLGKVGRKLADRDRLYKRSIRKSGVESLSAYDLDGFPPHDDAYVAESSINTTTTTKSPMGDDSIGVTSNWLHPSSARVVSLEEPSSTEESSESRSLRSQKQTAAPSISFQQDSDRSFPDTGPWIDCELDLSSGIIKTENVSRRQRSIVDRSTSDGTSSHPDTTMEESFGHLPPFHMEEESYPRKNSRGHRKVRSDNSYGSYVSSASSTSTRSSGESGALSYRSIRSIDDGDSPVRVNRRSSSVGRKSLTSQDFSVSTQQSALVDPVTGQSLQMASPLCALPQENHSHFFRSASPGLLTNKPSKPHRAQSSETSPSCAAAPQPHRRRSASLAPRLRPNNKDSPTMRRKDLVPPRSPTEFKPRKVMPALPKPSQHGRGRHASASERRRERSLSRSTCSSRISSQVQSVPPTTEQQLRENFDHSFVQASSVVVTQDDKRRRCRSASAHHHSRGSDRRGRNNDSQPVPLCRTDTTDQLASEIPSDVDPELKQRYLTACRILKQAMLTTNNDSSAIHPSEREFLASLIQSSTSGGKEVTTDQKLSVVEAASVISLHFDPTLAEHNENVSQLTLETRSAEESSGNNVRSHTRSSPSRSPNRSSPRRQPRSDCSFQVLGADSISETVLTPGIMEALQGLLPVPDRDSLNFLLKFSAERDGFSMTKLMSSVRSSIHTILAVKTTEGHVFGAFCSSPWRTKQSWYGSQETFLWKLKKTRREGSPDGDENELELYPHTGADNMVQYCTDIALAVGGGTDWDRLTDGCPYQGVPSGIGLLLDGDLLGGETNACVTFANPRLTQSGDSSEFEVKSLEMWTVTTCNTMEQAELKELSKMYQDDSM